MLFRHKKSRMHHWSIEKVETLSTNAIIRKLRDFGVDFRRKQFLEDVERFYSADELADQWESVFPISAVRFDRDFIWMAAIVLWQRLAPDVVNSEQLDEMMQRGYNLKDEARLKECCNLWLELWEHLKKRFTSDMSSIEDAERVFSGTQCLYNWCQDLEMELWNGGLEDTSFFRKSLEFCREFYRMFPDTDSLVIENMKRGEANSYFFLSEIEKGNEAFEKLIEGFPESAWGYIGWGDIYCSFTQDDTVPTDYDKAERIYRMGLDNATSDRDVIIERLQHLEEKRILR
jgi:tetratricopeptide (TPR) repeat protein